MKNYSKISRKLRSFFEKQDRPLDDSMSLVTVIVSNPNPGTNVVVTIPVATDLLIDGTATRDLGQMIGREIKRQYIHLLRSHGAIVLEETPRDKDGNPDYGTVEVY